MKLILTADVDHLGVPGDTVEVKDGYGRNYLLPRGLAIVASREPSDRPRRSGGPARSRPFAASSTPTSSRRRIEGLGTVELPCKTAADTGKLFGSVTAADVVAAIKKAGGPESGQAHGATAEGDTSRPSAPTRSRCGCIPMWTPLFGERRRRVVNATVNYRPGGGHDRLHVGVAVFLANTSASISARQRS